MIKDSQKSTNFILSPALVLSSGHITQTKLIVVWFIAIPNSQPTKFIQLGETRTKCFV